MVRAQYEELERYMLSCMSDAVHDKLHVYRVVHYAAMLAERTPEADADVVLAAALLHDVGRPAEYRDPSLCHAEVGSEMTREFLLAHGYGEDFARRVSACILTHRHKKGLTPESLEAKLVFDADKLDLIGAVGAARAALFGGQNGEPLYLIGADGMPTAGAPEEAPSLFREYRRKLRALSETLYTEAARELAARQQETMNAYFEAMIGEVHRNCTEGILALRSLLTD